MITKTCVTLSLLLPILLLLTLNGANERTNCARWNVISFKQTSIVGPFGALNEYRVLFRDQYGDFQLADILATRSLTANQLAAFAPQEVCSQ